MSRVQDAVLILERSTSAMLAEVKESVHRQLSQQDDVKSWAEQHTWPAVSIISVAYSWPLYLMVLWKVFSMVG
jgi:hypothetical protein